MNLLEQLPDSRPMRAEYRAALRQELEAVSPVRLGTADGGVLPW